MAKFDTGKSFNDLPKWAKGVIAVAVVGGLVYLGYKLIKKGEKSKILEGAKNEDNANKDELKNLNNNPKTKQTISSSQAAAMANAIFSAMDGYGTDSIAIMKQLNLLKNNADWLALSSAYGIREISSGKLNPEPNYIGTLSGALTSELGVRDVLWTAQANKLFIKNGINTRL